MSAMNAPDPTSTHDGPDREGCSRRAETVQGAALTPVRTHAPASGPAAGRTPDLPMALTVVLIVVLAVAWAVLLLVTARSAPSSSWIPRSMTGAPAVAWGGPVPRLQRVDLVQPVAHVLAVNDLPTIVTNLRNWVMGILAAVATLFLTIGGVRYVMAGGDPSEVERAKAAFKSAAIGYVLAVIAPVVLTVLKSIIGG
jgi:hypothetical protein